MTITKPGWAQWILSLVNLNRAQWLHKELSVLGHHIYTLDIPPFSVLIGDKIESAIDLTLDAINIAIDAIWDLVRKIPDILSALGGLFSIIYEQIAGVYGYIAGFSLQVWGWIRDAAADTLGKALGAIAVASQFTYAAIQTSKQEILDWTPGFVDSAIVAAFLPFRAPLNLLITFADDIQDFFKDPEEWLLNKIESMLVRFW